MEDAPISPPADVFDSIASLSGPGFQAFFRPGSVLLYNGREIRSRPLDGIDRQVVEMLRRKTATPSPAEETHAEGAEPEPHAESAEGAE